MEQESEVTIAGINEAEALHAAREFAAVLAETPEYEAFERAQSRLLGDAAAQAAVHALRERQQSLRTPMMLGALTEFARKELQRLQDEMLAQPAVRDYMEAQRGLSLLCQEAASLISETIGLSFAASCGPGCC